MNLILRSSVILIGLLVSGCMFEMCVGPMRATEVEKKCAGLDWGYILEDEKEPIPDVS